MAMTERRHNHTVRALIEQLDRRLRDAERLRNHLTQQPRLIWPDRRRQGRIPHLSEDEPEPTNGTE